MVHPVACLPSCFRTKLLNKYLQNFRHKYVGNLVTCVEVLFSEGGIDFLDLGVLDHAKEQKLEIVDIVLPFGKHLRQLIVSKKRLLPIEATTRLLSSVPNLLYMRISGIVTTDMYHFILIHCKLLQKLDVYSPIYIHQYLDNMNEIFPCLQELRVPTIFTKESLTSLKKAFPNLETLRCLDLYITEPIDFPNIKSLHLANPTDHMDSLISFPQIHTLSLTLDGWQVPINFEPFSELKSLRNLTIANDINKPLTYDDLTMSLIGPRLQYLTLNHFSSLNLIKISSDCPMLNTLVIYWFKTLEISNEATQQRHCNIFSCLKYLHLENSHSTDGQSSQVLRFLEQLSTRVTFSSLSIDLPNVHFKEWNDEIMW